MGGENVYRPVEGEYPAVTCEPVTSTNALSARETL